MRRFIAYATLAATMLVAIGVSTTPVFTEINPGLEFTNGYEITFEITPEEGEELPSTAAEEVANEMRTRLDNFNFEDYSVKVDTGYNKESVAENLKNAQAVTVSFSCEEDMYNNVCNYLSFSGRNLTFSGKDESYMVEDAIDYDNVYIDSYNDLVPILVIPLTESGIPAMVDLAEKVKTVEGDNNSKAAPIKADGHEGEEEGSNEQSGPDIFLWANYENGDNYETAANNPLIAQKIVLSLNSEQMFLTEEFGLDDDEDEHCKLMLICGSTDENNSYDFGKLKDANTMATYYYNMLKASEYKYVIDCPSKNVSTSGVNYFAGARKIDASYEELVSFTKSNWNLTASTILITTLITISVVAAVLAVYFKLSSIAIGATTLGSLFLSYAAFIGMNGIFNIPAVIGAVALLLSSLVPQIFHVIKMKEEMYKGRALKKANQEAFKKTNMISLDAAVITAFAGLMAYVLGGVSMKPFGIILFFGAIITLVMNVTVFRLLMNLLSSSTALQNSYKAFNVDETKIPNLMQEQKASYVAPFEKTDLTKTRKIGAIIMGLTSLASVFSIVFFGIKDGSPLNVKTATQDTVYITAKFEKTDLTSLDTVDHFASYALKDIVEKKEEKNETIYVYKLDNSKDDIIVDINVKTISTFKEETNNADEKYFSEYYFTVDFDLTLSSSELIELKTKIVDNISDSSIHVNNDYVLSVYNSREVLYTPNQGFIALATGVSIIGATIYLMLRYKASKGLIVGATTLSATAASYGLISLLRIGTSGITAVAMPVVALTSLLISLIYLSTEKTMLRDSREELTPEIRKEIMGKALGKAALPSVIVLGVMVFISVFYFGFGFSKTAFLFISMLIGELLSAYFLFALVGPWSVAMDNKAALIANKKEKKEVKKDNTFQPLKKNSSEPEETIFIGIND